MADEMQAPGFWQRIRDRIAGLFRRKPPEPGYFVSGSKVSWRGQVGTAPWIWPSREFLLYVPKGYGGWRRRSLLVFIHGCKQTAEEFATGTRIAAFADTHGMLVLLPRQNARANTWSCWNWFDERTAGGAGEAAIVAAQLRSVRRSYRVHPRRVLVAGMSSGGCLAAVLGLRYPKLFSGVVVHSGIACGAATSAMSALQVMNNGADARIERVADEARRDAPAGRPMPVLIVQGEQDASVAPVNAIQVLRQYLIFNGALNAGSGSLRELPPGAEHSTLALGAGRSMITDNYRHDRRLVARLVRVSGLGHAWSGGDPALPYNDPAPPDTTGLIGQFMAAVHP